jgi:hypothetical protein
VKDKTIRGAIYIIIVYFVDPAGLLMMPRFAEIKVSIKKSLGWRS